MSPKTWFRLLGLSCLLLVAGFVLPGLTDDAKKGKKYALLVGVTKYDSSKLATLTYTENDVVELDKILRGKTAGFDSVRVLTNKAGAKNRPTAANIRTALKELAQKRTRHDTILIALSGHGLQLDVPDPDDRGKPKTYSYFCPSDSDLAGKVSYSTGKSASLIQMKEILDALDNCGAGTKLLLMDACRNEMKAEATTRSLDSGQFTIPRNAAALFSCKEGQKAFETAKVKHGVFFHVVLQGLRGEAKNKRGEVTWAGLAEYVQENVNDEVAKLVGDGARQDPHFVNNLAGKSPVLVRLNAKEDAPAKDKDGGTKVVKGFLDKDGKNSIGMKFKRIPKGKFTMGSPKGDKDASDDEKPEHEVEITKDFYLGVHEVTQGQFREVMGFNPSYFSHDGTKSDSGDYEFSQPRGGSETVKGFTQKQLDEFPVELVSWVDAKAFLDKLNARAVEKENGRKYRLPTEAEWEYACRGGVSGKKYHFGDSISSDDVNFSDSKLGRTEKVGQYAPNKFGLHDMHGNVWEWCEDRYDTGFYANSPKRDPLNLKEGSIRVERGGSWLRTAGRCRSAIRYGSDRGSRDCILGFRVALVPAE